MTKQKFNQNFILVVIVYFLALVVGLVLAGLDYYFSVYADLIPFVVALPAVYLGFCFQRRQSFLNSLKSLWTKLIVSVQDSIQYTHLQQPGIEEYSVTLKNLSIVMEEIRGVYKNKFETNENIGIYTFESLKDIYNQISNLGYGQMLSEDQKKSRDEIIKCWKTLRKTFLRELDRSVPTYIDSPFIEDSKKKVY